MSAPSPRRKGGELPQKSQDLERDTKHECPGRKGRMPPVMDVDISLACSDPSHSTSVSHGKSKRSFAPMHYRFDYDPHRLPANISEAVCHRMPCSDLDGNKVKMSVQPIQMDLIVLRKPHKGSLFKLEVQRVTVGCTCVYPETHEA